MQPALVRRIVLVSTATVAGLFSAVQLNGQTFTDLRDYFRDVAGVGLSGGGAVVVGTSNAPEFSDRLPVMWTRLGGPLDLGYLPGGPDGGWPPLVAVPTGLSADGSVIVGYGPGSDDRFRPSAYRWTSASGWVELTPRIPDPPSPINVSADGSVIVGTDANFSAYRYAADTGVVDIDRYLIPRATSANGSVIVGANISPILEGAGYWTASTGMVGLGYPSWDAHAVSADGSIVVGVGANGAFRWTKDTGVMVLGLLPGGTHCAATALSADGSIIVGAGYTSSKWYDLDTFIWTPGSGMRRLIDMLATQYHLGDQLANWRLSSPTGISADGRFIVGNGIGPDGRSGGWLVDLGFAPVPEPTIIGWISAIGLLAIAAVRARRPQRHP